MKRHFFHLSATQLHRIFHGPRQAQGLHQDRTAAAVRKRAISFMDIRTFVFGSRIRLNLQAVALVAVLAFLSTRPARGQSSDDASAVVADAGDPQQSAQRSAGSNTPAGSNSPGTSPASQPQPIAVNPLTGLATTSAVNYQPLTGRERWKLYWKQNYLSVGAYFGPFFTALVLDQASNTPSAWGGGLEGFGKRFGSRIATAIVQGTVQASLAPLLDEDVRYIASGQTGFKRRLLHAIAFSFVTYNSQGHVTPNIANLSSYYAATAISTTWVPIHQSKERYILTNGTEQIALSVPINIVQEFWPEIRQKILHR